MTQSSSCFYLFASPSEPREESPSTVFYRVEGKTLAESLRRLCIREYSDQNGLPAFHAAAASSRSAEEQVLLDESLDLLALYDDPDPGIYEPPPSKHTLFLAQCAMRAQRWEQMLRGRIEPSSRDEPMESTNAAPLNSPTTDHQPGMHAEDWRNSGLILLWLLAQAYYYVGTQVAH